MKNAIKKFLRALVADELVAENASLKGELEHTQKTLKDVRAELSTREDEVKSLIDRYLYAMNIPMLYTAEPKKEKVYEDPFKGVSQGRDYSRIASMLESQSGLVGDYPDNGFVRN